MALSSFTVNRIDFIQVQHLVIESFSAFKLFYDNRNLKYDEFVKSRIHHVFGVSCLVFGTTYRMSNQVVKFTNTKHKILNTLQKGRFSTFYETVNV